MLRKIGSKYIFSLLIPVILGAGEIQFSATVSQTTVGLGQEFTLNVTVEGEDVGGVTAPELPPLADFTILNRSSSQSTSIQFINGKMSQQTT
ncbi:MAG: BatD family protein, partial [candidate division WOR-3 bacterium]